MNPKIKALLDARKKAPVSAEPEKPAPEVVEAVKEVQAEVDRVNPPEAAEAIEASMTEEPKAKKRGRGRPKKAAEPTPAKAEPPPQTYVIDEAGEVVKAPLVGTIESAYKNDAGEGFNVSILIKGGPVPVGTVVKIEVLP